MNGSEEFLGTILEAEFGFIPGNTGYSEHQIKMLGKFPTIMQLR